MIDDYGEPIPFPFIGDSQTGIHLADNVDEPSRGELPEHIAEALAIPSLGLELPEDGPGYEDILRAHARLMMERDLRGLRLPDAS